MCRIITCILRIASSTRQTNIRLAMAAQIFVAAGVLLVYVINLIFTQRLIRAQHPRWGWSKPFSIFLKLTYVVVVISLIMVITVTVQMFYTLNPNTRRIDRDVQLYCSTFFAYVSFLPIPLMTVSLILPRKTRVEKFGLGRWRTKVFVLLISSFVLCLGAAYRCGTAYLPPVPMTQPLPSYYSRACFYVFNFVLEILIIYLYIFARIDRRFHVPNGAKGHGSYVPTKAGEPKRISLQTKKNDSVQSGIDRASTTTAGTRYYTEDEGYDDTGTPRTLNLKTDFSSNEKRKMDVEAQNDPHSAISGTTAALSKDHLLLPESPKAAHFKSEKHSNVPPVPPLPPSATGAIPNLYSPAPNVEPQAPSTKASDEKLDKVVDLLVSLDRRLSYLEEAPRRESGFDLLDRLNRRLSNLEEPSTTSAGAVSPHMRAQSSGATSTNNTNDLDNSSPAINLLDRLDRRLSRLEEHETRASRHHSGLDSLLMMERRLSQMESRIASPAPRGRTTYPDEYVLGNGMGNPLAPPAGNRFERWSYDAAPGAGANSNVSPRLRGGGTGSPAFSQSPSRFSARAAAAPVAAASSQWPLDEEAEQQQHQHPSQLRPGYVRAHQSTDSMGTVTLNNVEADDDEDDTHVHALEEAMMAEQHQHPPQLVVGRAFTPDDDRPHRLEVAVEQPLRYSTSVASATSQYSQATEIDTSRQGRGEQQ